jgi:hypothetical protein
MREKFELGERKPSIQVLQDEDKRWRVYQMPERKNLGSEEGFFSRIEAFMFKVKEFVDA